MQIDLSNEDAEILRETLQERVRGLDVEINKTDSLRNKDALRDTERRLERILAAVRTAMHPTSPGPSEWEPRDTVPDTDTPGRP